MHRKLREPFTFDLINLIHDSINANQLPHKRKMKFTSHNEIIFFFLNFMNSIKYLMSVKYDSYFDIFL